MVHDAVQIPEVQALSGKTFLVCLGAAKCGTSWLHSYLSGFPEMAVSPLKELHFFNAKFGAHAMGDMQALALKRLALHLKREGNLVETLRLSAEFQASVDAAQMIYDEAAYFAHFARLASSQTKAFCDVTPAYSALGSNGFDYMAKVFATQPDLRLRLLFILRDPIDRLWSQLRHLQEINPDGAATERWADALKSPALMARSDYVGTISDLELVFGAHQIHYLFYEDLFSEGTLRQLCEFVELDYLPGALKDRKNRTRLEADLPAEARAAFSEALSNQYTYCREKFGARIPPSWAD